MNGLQPGRSGRGKPVSRERWPATGAQRDWLAFCDNVHRENGLPSLRALGREMHVAATRVGELLRGEGLPVNEQQARALLTALGATDGKIRQGVRLYLGARAERDRTARAAGPPGWWQRSGYIGLVGDIAPLHLLGRADELKELAGGDEAYVRWEAGPGAGKSALMSWFVRHPPAGTWVISFFVTARLAAQADSTAFTDGLLDQLAAITGEQVPPSTPAVVRDGLRRRLLEQAAEQAVKAGRRLVLVVDGLDEDCGSMPGSGLPSVAACLPKRPPDGLRVIVAGRPDPPLPADVDPDHPLHSCPVRFLGASPYAADAMQRAQRELDEVLAADRHRNDGLGYKVLGLVTAAGGGLGDRDLQQLTGRPAFEIDRLLGGVFGRTIASRPAPHAAKVFLFTHETLREQATERLGPDILDSFARRLHAWADGYRQRRWPADTPDYLLRGYPRMLVGAGDADRLAALAADPARHHRMLAGTRGDAAALAEIAAAHALINTSAFPDLLAALRLAWHRGQLAGRNAHIPFKLPAVWVTLGQPVRAEALARSIPYESQRALALAGVAMAAAGAGDYDRARELAADAEQIARSTADPRRRAQVLAAAAAGAGDYDRAERIARSTAISLYDKPEILAAVAMAAARIGDYDRARELADHAERIARSITPLDLQSLPLAEVAMAAAGAGDYDRARALAANAEQIARSITNPTWRARNLAPAAAAAGAGDYDRAERIARSAADPDEQARALAEVAMAAAGAGDYDRARELAANAEQIARSITNPDEQARDLATAVALVGDYDRAERIARSAADPDEQARALAEVAMAAAGAGDYDRARELAANAEQIARSMSDRAEREDILARVATVAARAGDYDRAERIAWSITHPDEQAGTLAAVATVAARVGDYDLAERIARSITHPDEQARALAEVATTAAGAGDYDRAELLARSITHPDEQARVLAAAVARVGDYDHAEQIARSITHPYTQALALAGMASSITEPARARSWIASALAAGPWTVPLEALARTDPATLSAFTSDLAACPDLPRTTG